MSLPNHIPKHRRSAVSQRWHEAKARRRMEREPDFETQRLRALWDAKGQTIREGCTMRAAGTTHWILRRSVHGRVNQVDLLIDGQLWRTGALRSALSAIRWQKWLVRKPQSIAA